MLPAAFALLASGVLALAAYAGVVVLALALLLVQAFLVLLWQQVTRPLHPRGVYAVTGAAALGADAAVVLPARTEPTVGPLAAVLGLVVVASLVQQLLRREEGRGFLASVAASTTLGTLVTLAAGLLAAQVTEAGPDLVACVTGGAALGVLALPLAAVRVPRPLTAPLALAAAVVFGYVVGGLSDVIGPGRGAVLAGVGGLVTSALLVVAARPSAPERAQNLLASALALTIACPLTYVLGRLVVS